MKLFDERDTMFSRLGLVKGTKKYRDYYAAHPDWQEEDDRVRKSTSQAMARIFRIDPEHMKKKSERLSIVLKIINIFMELTGKKMSMNPERMLSMGAQSKEKGDVVWSAMTRPAARMANQIQLAAHKQKIAGHKVNVDPGEMSGILKTLAMSYGANLAGIARLKTHHHYSHRGDMFGLGGGYGKPLRLSYPYAVVIAAELDRDMINRAPGKETQIAAMLGYARSASATAQLALYIKSLGYEALTDNFIEYASPMTPLAADAGLGQIGRCNMVVNPIFGNRLKIGAVLTNLPLAADEPDDFGLRDFCRICQRCAKNCPAKAISFEDPQLINGHYQWQHNETRCMEMWMTVGTGICMAICPFSQGIDLQMINQMKGNPAFIKSILSSFEERTD